MIDTSTGRVQKVSSGGSWIQRESGPGVYGTVLPRVAVCGMHQQANLLHMTFVRGHVPPVHVLTPNRFDF